jgi:hypothetical protein
LDPVTATGLAMRQLAMLALFTLTQTLMIQAIPGSLG